MGDSSYTQNYFRNAIAEVQHILYIRTCEVLYRNFDGMLCLPRRALVSLILIIFSASLAERNRGFDRQLSGRSFKWLMKSWSPSVVAPEENRRARSHAVLAVLNAPQITQCVSPPRSPARLTGWSLMDVSISVTLHYASYFVKGQFWYKQLPRKDTFSKMCPQQIIFP